MRGLLSFPKGFPQPETPERRGKIQPCLQRSPLGIGILLLALPEEHTLPRQDFPRLVPLRKQIL